MYRIMAVIEQCMCGEVGERLGDIEVCEMLETVLTTCCQMRLSGKKHLHPAGASLTSAQRFFVGLRKLPCMH